MKNKLRLKRLRLLEKKKLIESILNEEVYKEDKYFYYIQSGLWGKRKKEYYTKHKKECSICGSRNKVSLHHIVYKDFGREDDSDLTPLCGYHHERFHTEYGTKKDMHRDMVDYVNSIIDEDLLTYTQ